MPISWRSEIETGFASVRSWRFFQWLIRARDRLLGTPSKPMTLADEDGYAIVLPILLLLADPVIFKASKRGWAEEYLESFAPLAYLLIAFEISVFILWRWKGARLGVWGAPTAGCLYAGGVLAFTIGLVCLPLSLIGTLFMGLGLLGFIPFITGVVYTRNARRAYRQTTLHTNHSSLTLLTIRTIILILVPAAFVQVCGIMIASQATHDVIRGESESSSRAAVSCLKRWRAIAHPFFDEIAWAYDRETDKARRERLARWYRELTEVDVERRLRRLKD